ncbi:DUF3558 domain-containing protein [Streptomyces formicae]|uniref:DUF3558 domain-containing protein n=1 Tax=Streptomyces formicae TaxID=1616117 RepID=A0ABY3WDJ0_9ACTN|nr:DUF3558 domain-containing protein [Streptomyces formicae]UNM10618.1 DUF3558 domain-containing protein [Streptomyces formicae]
MQRKAYATALAALLVAFVGGCSAGSGDDGAAADTKAGEAPAAAAPGKYRTLYEPCGAVERATLRDLLPGAAQLPEEQQEKVYKGTAAVTYDTDRRVGCSWKADAPDASHQLRIDVERVVSYDPAVSDDTKAQEVYGGKRDAAQLPSPVDPRNEQVQETRSPGGSPSTPTPSSSSSTSTGAGTGTGKGASAAGASGTTAPTVTPSGTAATPEGLEPRELDGLADAAFLDDALTRAGSTAQHRTVSVVFRTSNVIVTVEYVEQPARTTVIPDSKELQEKAQALARNLAERFND